MKLNDQDDIQQIKYTILENGKKNSKTKEHNGSIGHLNLAVIIGYVAEKR